MEFVFVLFSITCRHLPIPCELVPHARLKHRMDLCSESPFRYIHSITSIGSMLVFFGSQKKKNEDTHYSLSSSVSLTKVSWPMDIKINHFPLHSITHTLQHGHPKFPFPFFGKIIQKPVLTGVNLCKDTHAIEN